MRKLVLTVLISGGLLAAAVGGAAANEGAVKYRQSVFKAIGGHTGALAGIVKGEVDHKGDAKPHAKALGALGPMVKHIFPEGSDTGNTEALPVIWEKPEDFAKAEDAFIEATANLSAAADGDDLKAIAGALGQLGKTCKSCHDTFRKKK